MTAALRGRTFMYLSSESFPTEAGLLARGIAQRRHLPRALAPVAGFAPSPLATAYSGGTAPGLHRLPSLAPRVGRPPFVLAGDSS